MNSENPHISVVIVTLNGRPYLTELLPSLAAQTFQDFEIIVVDNGSTDGSADYIAEKFPSVTLLRSTKNNFGYANNVGIRAAHGRYVFILNNDTALDVDCLSQLAKATREGDNAVAMWAAKVLNYYQRDVIDSAGLAIYPDGLSRGRGRQEKDNGQFGQREEVIFPSGCAGLYRKVVLDAVGLFDEEFEFYLEDSDLGFRIRLAGWTCTYIPSAMVYHKYSATTGGYSSRKAFLVERNRIWLTLKLFSCSRLLLVPYHAARRYLYQLYGVLTGKGAAARFTHKHSPLRIVAVLLHAWLASIPGIPSMLRKRWKVRSNVCAAPSTERSWFAQFSLPVREVALKD